MYTFFVRRHEDTSTARLLLEICSGPEGLITYSAIREVHVRPFGCHFPFSLPVTDVGRTWSVTLKCSTAQRTHSWSRVATLSRVSRAYRSHPGPVVGILARLGHEAGLRPVNGNDVLLVD